MKYETYKKIDLKNRKWPDKQTLKAPTWCSVDLRDGNQALLKPMDLEKKISFFKLLVEIGFKEIEIGFPSASDTEYNFARYIIENNLIPDDVTIQVLTPARENLIEKTKEAVKGAKNLIVHLYNSTSTVQRETVFQKTEDEIIDIALDGIKWIRKSFNNFDGNLKFEYSPESYTGTELEFAKKICNAVITEWNPREEEKIIINLPATVEVSTPNIYADSIEWMSNNLIKRDNVIISLHVHNDRGTAIASTELGLLAGGERVEGTLLGNGERTGNVDLLTLGLNLFTQGVNPNLDFSNIDKINDMVEYATEIKTGVRHPYIGKLVYTAYSGSHQDAIKKGMEVQKDNSLWKVPYLPIDPRDIGRSYEQLIQINSQSGKGGISYILEHHFGYKIPKDMQPYISSVIENKTKNINGIIDNKLILDIFEEHFINKKNIYSMSNLEVIRSSGNTFIKACFLCPNKKSLEEINSQGILIGIVNVYKKLGIQSDIIDYSQHSMEQGTDAKAITYLKIKKDNKFFYGIGIDRDITRASIYAFLSALNISEIS